MSLFFCTARCMSCIFGHHTQCDGFISDLDSCCTCSCYWAWRGRPDLNDRALATVEVHTKGYEVTSVKAVNSKQGQ
jgi:hypothetical protein